MKFLLPLINLIYPKTCSICNQKTSDHFCAACWDKIEYINPPFCPTCGKPFSSDISLSHSPDHLCSECRITKTYFDKAIAVGPYEGTLSKAIHLFKYNRKRGLSRSLGKIMIDYMNSNPSLLPAGLAGVMPVPLHPKRLREREFNQSLLLAKEISCALMIPLILNNLQRVRWTRPQIELKGEERLLNVRGAFGLENPEGIKGRSFLLVDDVYTTGATVRECSKVLKKAEAEKVYVLTLARVI